MLTLWNPFSTLSRWSSDAEWPFSWADFAITPRTAATYLPKVDVREDDGAYHLEVDLPGVEPKEVKVNVDGRVLTISGERKAERRADKDGYHRYEKTYGAFSRSFELPQDASAEQIDAASKNGVLAITVPKKPQAEASRSIEVKADG